MTDTKRMHFVPQVYLRSWANDSKQVCVRRRGSTEAFSASIRDIAVSTHLYGKGNTGQLREKMFGELEDAWPDLREALLTDGGFVTRSTREKIALFMALQFVRTRESGAQYQFLRDFAEYSSTRPISKDQIRTYLRERHLRAEPSEAEVDGAWTIAGASLNVEEPPSLDEEMRAHIDIAIKVIGPRFGAYRWRVERCSKPILFTSDRPVMAWRPPSVRDTYEGIGLEGADEIRFPLDPQNLLVMQRGGTQLQIAPVQEKRFHRVNVAVASQCQDQIIGTRDLKLKLEGIPMADWRPTIRFNTGPGYQDTGDGNRERIGDVVHVWSPTHV